MCIAFHSLLNRAARARQTGFWGWSRLRKATTRQSVGSTTHELRGRIHETLHLLNRIRKRRHSNFLVTEDSSQDKRSETVVHFGSSDLMSTYLERNSQASTSPSHPSEVQFAVSVTPPPQKIRFRSAVQHKFLKLENSAGESGTALTRKYKRTKRRRRRRKEVKRVHRESEDHRGLLRPGESPTRTVQFAE